MVQAEYNYEDARFIRGENEVGIGKIYNKDGSLKYEWYRTNGNKVGFRKSYNRNGELRAATYYDQQGHITKDPSSVAGR